MAPPAAVLAPYIDSYIGYRLTGFSPGLHRGLPSANMTFIVSIGGAIDVVTQTDPTQSPRRYQTVVSGLHSAPALIAHEGHQEGVAVVLSPLGSRTLFGMPARELWNTSVELSEVVGSVGDELWERVQLGDGWDQRLGIMNAMLSTLINDSAVPMAAEVAFAWDTLMATTGEAPVSRVADAVGWSRQHLTRRFRDEFGTTPKVMGRVHRFGRAVRMIESGNHSSLSEVAMTCGYSDQAHMTKDFGDLAGCTPGRLLEGEIPNFQDTAGTPA